MISVRTKNTQVLNLLHYLWSGCSLHLYTLGDESTVYIASLRGASDSVTDSSVLSNPADAQNVSCLGLCGRNICPKSSV